MAVVDLTLNRFAIANMPSFYNEFGVKKPEPNKGCSTAENTINMMLPFLKQRPISITSNTQTSSVEANASINLVGNISSLILGDGAYKGVELLIINDANDDVVLVNNTKTITTKIGDNITIRWNGEEWRVKHDFLVGDFYEQIPSAKSPIEKSKEGTWVNWSHRAIMYGISNVAPAAHVNYYSIVNTIIPANTSRIVMYHVNGSDYQLFRFRQTSTAYTVPAELDPVRWEELKPDTVDIRESCQKLSIRNSDGEVVVTDDLEIGNQISGGIHSGKYITAVYVLGGKFLSVDGGFRPPFGSGVAEDVQRPITGTIGLLTSSPFNASGTGAFKETLSSSYQVWNGNQINTYLFDFDSSLVVPVGNENAPRTLTVLYWRRIA